MDPDATLAQIRELVRTIHQDGATGSLAIDLAEKVEAIDEWLSKGGFLPDDWTKVGT